MTRGNQRDLARAKNLKKQQEQSKSKSAAERTGISTDKRLDRDADIMRQKQQKALEKKAADDAAKAAGAAKVVKFDPLK